MSNPVAKNPLRTRQDVENAAVSLLAPLADLLSPGKARLDLGHTGAVYPKAIAEMEAYSRALWAIVPMLMGKCEGVAPFWTLWKEGLKNGTDPTHPEYWGTIGDKDQRMVEMAVMGMGLCFIPETFFLEFSQEVQKNIHSWLWQINEFDMPTNNWRFFRVLVNTGFLLNDLPYSQSRLEEDFGYIESHYEGDGWYYDYFDQREYYTFWAYHYYGLLYAKVMEKRDKQRSETYRERARVLAPRFALWFDKQGNALPYGRSLTYRFAESAFFAALAFDGQETKEVDYGVMKGILLNNMRQWFSRPIFTRDGILTIGYGYPNLNMAEGYNAPGSPYWALKAFLVLALPQSHPFWQAEEKPFLTEKVQFLEEHGRLLLTMAKDGSHVQAFQAGNHAQGHAHDDAKYEKFCYSTAFAFSVPKSSTLLMRGAYDSMLAFSQDGKMWHPRYGVETFDIKEDRVTCTWKPFLGVHVDTTLYPVGEWHIRIHRIVSNQPLLAAEGGYAFPPEEGEMRATTEENQGEARVYAPWGSSGIIGLKGYESAEILTVEPNTNILYPRSVIPTLHANIPVGETVLVCMVLGAKTQGEEKWKKRPGEENVYAAMGKGSL
ncbi:MAG: DUF2264 domain-containing protein [Clostridiales bacterium]|nr:DUF2264 domain-containing protein [Clostridiales bacterium]